MIRVQEDPDIEFRLEAGAQWIEIPLSWSGDAADWAAEAVDRALALRELAEPEAVRRLYIEGLAAFAEQTVARDRGDDVHLVGVYVLAPEQDVIPVTSAELACMPMDPEKGLDAFVEGLVLPSRERFGEPVVTTISTRNGDATRIKQLGIIDAPGDADGDETEQRVVTLVLVVWPGPVDGLATVLHAYFGSPVDAELCEDQFDELARSLTVTQVAAR